MKISVTKTPRDTGRGAWFRRQPITYEVSVDGRSIQSRWTPGHAFLVFVGRHVSVSGIDPADLKRNLAALAKEQGSIRPALWIGQWTLLVDQPMPPGASWVVFLCDGELAGPAPFCFGDAPPTAVAWLPMVFPSPPKIPAEYF